MSKKRITRKEARERVEQVHLSGALAKVIRRFFPGLIKRLKEVSDPRHQSYITYENYVLLMTRILSAVFYISSMRKSSEELNSTVGIANIGEIVGKKLEEIPYWETINNYLERIDPPEMQEVIYDLVRHLIRCKAFDGARISKRFWQVILDGTQLVSSRNELDGAYTFKVHNKGTEKEYKEYCYYVLEAKLVLADNIYVSIMSEFVENAEKEYNKQDCERKAAVRLMARLKEKFPRLPICISGDSLYACEPVIRTCEENHWVYLLRFKKGSIPSVQEEKEALSKIQGHKREVTVNGVKCIFDYVSDIDYRGFKLNYAHYDENDAEKAFDFITNLPISQKTVEIIIAWGRRRWGIENRGFNDQKNHGFYLEHLFSKNYWAMKNHYYLIQIAHMISQIVDAWSSIWEGIHQSREQKHRRMLESWKTQPIDLQIAEKAGYQIRFG